VDEGLELDRWIRVVREAGVLDLDPVEPGISDLVVL
jgi:hypothetical protein